MLHKIARKLLKRRTRHGPTGIQNVGHRQYVGGLDAKCYEAKHPDCTCVCQGANHGAGFDQAQENTEQMAEQWIEEYAAARGLEEYESQVARFGKQLTLF